MALTAPGMDDTSVNCGKILVDFSSSPEGRVSGRGAV